MKKVYIASDHAGFPLKSILVNHITSLDYKIYDLGTDSEDSVDYPDYAQKLCKKLNRNDDVGILICGTGAGMSISSNKFRHIRAALCSNVFEAEMSRKHNDANVLCLGGRVIGAELAKRVVKVWLETNFTGEERHTRRIKKISAY